MVEILVIDDDATEREAVVAQLRAAGHRVVATDDLDADDEDSGRAPRPAGELPADLVVLHLTGSLGPRELARRLAVALRRAGGPPGTIVDRDLELDPERREARIAGRSLPLTRRELDLLHFLMTHPGRTWSRQDLLRDVWGWTFGDASTVTVHVRRLRGKLEADPSHPVRLITVWGLGYRWEAA